MPDLAKRDQFDFVTTFDAVHDSRDPEGFPATAHRLLRRGGAYLCVDIHAEADVEDNRDLPAPVFGYTISLFHCMSVSLAEGGPGLGSMWGREKALTLLDTVGFADVTVERVDGDRVNNYYVAWKR